VGGTEGRAMPGSAFLFDKYHKALNNRKDCDSDSISALPCNFQKYRIRNDDYQRRFVRYDRSMKKVACLIKFWTKIYQVVENPQLEGRPRKNF
jgi:hypothetical protein